MKDQKTKIRVVHLTNKLTIGGKGRFLLSLCKAALKLSKDVEFFILCFSSLGELTPEFEKLGIKPKARKLIKHGYSPRAWISFFSFAKELKNTPANLYQIHGYPPLMRVGLACSILKLPFLAQYHSYHPPYRKKLWLFFEKLVLSKALYTLHVSHATKESVVRRCFVEPKGSVIYNCPDRKFIKGKRKRDAIWVARFSTQKRPLDFVKAVKEAQKLVNIKATMVGGGDLFSQAKEEGRENLEFTGFVKDVEEYLSSSCVGVLTSEREGIGISVLEYMKFGLPIVAYKLPAIFEIVPDKVGKLIPIGDIRSLTNTLIKLKIYPSLTQKLSINALRFSERFSCEGMAKSYLEIYRRLT